MLLYLILCLVFLAAAVMTLLALRLLARSSDPAVRKIRRLENMAGNKNPKADLRAAYASANKKIKFGLGKTLSMMSRFAQKNERADSKLRRSLMQAGYYQENSVRNFSSLKILSAVILFLGYGFLGLVGGAGLTSIFLIALFMALVGYVLPPQVLRMKIRRRQDAIAAALPDFLDFLVICVEAGLGLNFAIMRVGQELQLRCKALGEELLLVNQELRVGVSREQAFRNLSQRIPIDDLRIMVSALILADRLGTNIADTLRVQSDSLRTRIRQRAEEKAAKASTKLLFPLVFLIMPALFIVILGPGIILVIKTLGPILR